MLDKLKPLTRLIPIGAGAAVSSAIVGSTAASKRGTEGVVSKTVSSLSRSTGQKAAFETAQEYRLPPASKKVFERSSLQQPNPVASADTALASANKPVARPTAKPTARPAVVGHFAVRCQPPPSLLHPPPPPSSKLSPSLSPPPPSPSESEIVEAPSWDNNNPSIAIFESIIDNEPGPLNELVDDLLDYMDESKYISDELRTLQGKLMAFQWQDGDMVVAEKVW